MKNGSRGVYFLANDRVIDLAIAFLNSFRRFNAETPLCLVPFDERIERLADLRCKYDFRIFSDNRLLIQCDEISQRFFARPCGQFRKLAIWSGMFDEFVYVDVDTIVQHDLSFAFDFLDEYDVLTSHSNMTTIRRWVWKESIYSAGGLTQEQIDYAANTGFIVSKHNILPLEIVTNRLEDAVLLSPHMELLCAEQPFLNYLIVTSGRPYSSLHEIARRGRRIDIPLERWAGAWFGYVIDGLATRPPIHPPILLVHWAGEWHRGCHESDPLWKYYRHTPCVPR